MDVADNFHFLFTAVAKTDSGGGCGVKKSKIVKRTDCRKNITVFHKSGWAMEII